MMQLPYRALCQGIALALALSTAHAAPAAEPAKAPSVEAFFNNPPLADATLSPSGKYLAVRSAAPGHHDFLVVIDLATNSGKGVAEHDDADIDEFRWVNDDRLVYTVGDKRLGVGDSSYAPGLFTVKRDGSSGAQLVSRQGNWENSGRTGTRVGHDLLPWHTFLLEKGQRGAQDSDYIYVISPEQTRTRKIRAVNLLRLNTITGKAEIVPRPTAVQDWMLDNNGEPRLAAGTEKDLTTLYYRDPASGQWRKLASFDAFGKGQEKIVPIGFAPDGQLYVAWRGEKDDTSSVHTIDLATGKVNPEPVMVTKGYDFSGGLVTTKDKLLGLHFTTDAISEEWIDPDMKAMQETVDKLLPATVNLLKVPARPQAPWVLVTAYSDAVPPTYFLYNKETKLVSKVSESRPGINPQQMGRQQAFTYKTRDGLEIPALLTLPPGKKANVPMVVLVHGGPWVRGSTWGWHPMSQFLATRGYAVLEPEFRGATGLGAKIFTAGFKQWGLKMQDDVADATRYVIGKGIADARRICIAGASYGGYATLMGLVNDPDLYKCGVEWVGVTDINLMYNESWNYRSDLSDEWKQYGMPEIIGDQVKDAAQLKATSPIEQAARIKQPLLMAYGGVDERVPMYHGKKFYDAVTRTNQDVEWIEYPDEAHGWQLPKNNYDFWTRVEKFLDRNIGSGVQKQQ